MALVETANGITCNTSVMIDKNGCPWSLVASTSGLQVMIKGTIDTSTANVTQLLYWNHAIYQQTAGQWYKRISGAWSPTPDPRTTESVNGARLTSAVGTIVDASQGVWALVSSASSLQISHNGVLDTNTANVTLLLYWNHVLYQQNSAGGWWSWNGGWFATTDPRVASESISGTTVTSSGTIVDSAGVKWTLVPSASSGLQAASNGAVDTATANIVLLLYWNHLVYQQNSAGGWWYWSGSWAASSDPRVTASNSVNVNLATATGVAVPATLWGIGSSGDMASNKFAVTSNSAWQAAAKSLNLSLYRPNFGNSNVMANLFATQGSPDWSHIDTLLTNLPTFFNLNAGRLLVTLGGNAPSWINITTAGGQAQFADLCVQIAKRFVASGVECHWWELWNEPDSVDITTYCDLFNATSAALKSYAASRGQTYSIGGVTDSYLQSDRITTLAKNCQPDFLSYHQYATGPGDGSFQPGNLADTPSIMQRAIANYAQAASDCRQAVAGTPAANLPIFVGEWNICYTPDSGGGNYNIDPRQVTTIGAVFAALAMYSAVTSGKNVTMAALWELYADTYYGVVRSDFSIDPQGYLFKRLASYMSGQQVAASVTGTMNVKCLATVNGTSFCVLLINYDIAANYAINLGVAGATASSATCYAITDAHPAGVTQTLSMGSLANLSLPAMSVTIISN